MGAGRHGPLHLHLGGDGPLVRMAPEAKLVGALALMTGVVLAPRGSWASLAVAAAVVAGVVVVAQVPPAVLARRCMVEVPFVAFALAMPLFGEGRTHEVLGLTLYESGIEAGATLLAKATLGVVVAVALSATTTLEEVLAGMARLRVPLALVLVVQQMLRYGEVLVGEARRMRQARLARGEDARWLWQARGFATSLGALFVRSVERGERVQRAMVARGFDGRLPDTRPAVAPSAAAWTAALAPAAVVVAGLVAV